MTLPTDYDEIPPLKEKRGKGRPKGSTRGRVLTRGVTIDDDRWAWLQVQPGGASAAIRNMVDAARKNDRPLRL